jgi:hypothetical protein
MNDKKNMFFSNDLKGSYKESKDVFVNKHVHYSMNRFLRSAKTS